MSEQSYILVPPEVHAISMSGFVYHINMRINTLDSSFFNIHNYIIINIDIYFDMLNP